MIRLSVLDQSPVPEGSTAGDALRNTLDLARRTEAMGYHRYWVAEHHGMTGLAGSSPEALIGSIAGATDRIRVGSGGVRAPPRARAAAVRWSEPGARPTPRSMRPG